MDKSVQETDNQILFPNYSINDTKYYVFNIYLDKFRNISGINYTVQHIIICVCRVSNFNFKQRSQKCQRRKKDYDDAKENAKKYAVSICAFRPAINILVGR